MSREIDFKIQRNRLKLRRYRVFNWKKYFLKTFVFLLILDIFMLITIPQNLSNNELLFQLALSLWIILLVCAIFTPIIGYWYKTRHRNVILRIQHLRELKKLKSKPRQIKVEDSPIEQ